MRLLRLLIIPSICFSLFWPVTGFCTIFSLSDLSWRGLREACGLNFARADLLIASKNLTSMQVGTYLIITIIVAVIYFLISRYRNLSQRSILLQLELRGKDEKLSNVTDDNKQLLLEKDRLLKKVHHRVKNNLQIMLSLLHTQSAYLTDPAAISAINDSEKRMQAMIVMQKKLYESEDIAQISMISFIRDLITYLLSSLDTQLLTVDITGTELNLSVTQAGFVGLLINESLINILKFLDSKGEAGRLLIYFGQTDGGKVDLTITYFNKNPGGLRKIKNDIDNAGLMLEVAHQLNGSFRITERQGLEISLVFARENVFYEMN